MIKYYVKTDENGVIIAQSSNLCLSPEEIEVGGWQPIPESIEGMIFSDDDIPLYKHQSGKITKRNVSDIESDKLYKSVLPMDSITELQLAITELYEEVMRRG